MGIFDRLFGRKPNPGGNGSIYQTLTGYRPAFRTWGGQMYENELIRAVVDAKARHISKLRVEFVGPGRPDLKTVMKVGPNEWETWPVFLYRLFSMRDIQNNAFIIPVLDKYGRTCGYFPAVPTQCEVISDNDVPYLRYRFANGKTGTMEMSKCGILPKHQLKDDFFGEPNTALNSTLQLLDMQNQGITEGIKNSAFIRFIAKLSNFTKPEDLKKERKRFNDDNLHGDSGGLLLFPNYFSDIKQVESKPYVVDAAQMELIRTNVFNYFGVNEKILQNNAIGDDLDAFFDGCIEPFAILLSEVLTRMTFTEREIATGNRVMVTANRLQYMSTANKISLAQQMGDRGVLSINEIRELFNYPKLEEGGEFRPARGEYNWSLGMNEDKTGDDNDE